MLVAVLALATTIAAQASLAPGVDAQDRDASLVPRPREMRLASLGFLGLAADYYWLRAVQIVGHEKGRQDLDPTFLDRLVDLTVQLDPWVDHPYRFAALWMRPDEASVRATNRLLERGVAYHPLDWRNRFYLSFNHFFHLGDTVAAADELEPAVALEGAPNYLARLLARLRSSENGLDGAAAFLQEMAQQTEDPWERAEYEKALDEIETERRARFLDRARDVFRARHRRDILNVEDLVTGPDAVLPDLPPELHGWGWVIHPDTGEIVSAFYRRRYQLHFNRVAEAAPAAHEGAER
jgi:hypothetical protein